MNRIDPDGWCNLSTAADLLAISRAAFDKNHRQHLPNEAVRKAPNGLVQIHAPTLLRTETVAAVLKGVLGPNNHRVVSLIRDTLAGK